MAYDLTLTSPAFSAATGFGQKLSGGQGVVSSAALFPTNSVATIEFRINIASAPGALQVALGTAGSFYIAVNPAGKIVLQYQSTTITGSINVCNGVDRHIEISWGTSGCYLFVDGVQDGSNAALLSATPPTQIGLRYYPDASGFDFSGSIDEVAVWSITRHTSAFTPVSVPYTGSETGLLALWHLDGNGTNSKASGIAASVVLSLSANSGNAGVPVTVTVGTDAALTGSQSESVALSCNIAGTFSPASVTLDASTPTATLTFTPSSTGTATITGSATGTPTIANGTATYSIGASNNALVINNVLFSPYNWYFIGNTAKSVNPGAYFKTIFGGSSCILNFNISGVSAASKISYRVDGFGSWITVDVAASVTITIPTLTADYASKPGHFLEVVFKAIDGGQDRWSSPTGLFLTAIILDSGQVLTKPPAKSLNCIFYGDSITEGVRSVNAIDAIDTNRNDASQSWAYLAAGMLGAEIGQVGFAGSGWIASGIGNVPPFPSNYNYVYSGVARSFTLAPDFIVINAGANDGTSTVTSAVTTVLNGLLAATPSSTRIIVLRSFNGSGTTGMAAGIAACTAPSRVTYVDTSNFFTTANSADALHPYGVENLTHIAPLVANAIRSILAGTYGLTTRTVSVTLKTDGTTLAANLTGLKVSFYDEASPDLTKTVRYQSNSQTTNASGVLTFSCGTLLSPGVGGRIDVKGAGLHYSGVATVS